MRPPSRWFLHPVCVSATLALALTLLLYTGALTLPLFSDDLIQIPWLQSISCRELWTAPSPYGYYRPLWYSLWRLWGGLTGGLRPFGLHLLNLLAHAVAAALAGLLAVAWVPASTRLGRALNAGIATSLFAAFPFSRQAVIWPGAVYSPLVSAMVAGSLLAYDRARATGRRRWLSVALLLAGFAPLVYEVGLLAGPAVVLAEAVGWLHQRWPRRRSWWPLAFVALSLLTLGLWRFSRGAGVVGFGLAPGDLRRNVGYLVQGLVFPIAPLGQWLAGATGLGPEAALWIVAVPWVVWLVWVGVRYASAPLALGVGWFLLFSLPPVITMEADWFALAPRYLYMTAGGIALVWVGPVSTLLGGLYGRLAAGGNNARVSSLRRVAGTFVALILPVALLAPAIIFARRGVALYRMAGDVLWQAASAARLDETLLLVNLPSRITPQARFYPLGFEGITPLPKRVSASQLVTVNAGVQNAAEAIAFGIGLTGPPPTYTYEIFGREAGYGELISAVRTADTVYLASYEADHIELEEAGGIIDKAPARGEPLACFGPGVELLSASVDCDAQGQVHLILDWQTPVAVDTDASVFAHLLDDQGTVRVQADGYPLLGMLPFWLWEPGEAVRDVRRFPAVAGGDYTVRLGLWEPATGKRWPAADQPDGMLYLPVRCP